VPDQFRPAWQVVADSDDDLERRYTGDPGDLVDALDDLLGDRPAWHVLAACRAKDPSNFYVERGQDIAPARALCAVCPVREDCLEHALAQPERDGVWGGLSVQERRRLRRRRSLGEGA
jgi:WhiB family redox-sensing transcriptional regulator